MRNYATEFVGTFFLVFTIGLTVVRSLRDLWLYLVGPLIGGTLAVPVFRLQHAAQ